jgi:hypothetical protein
VIPLLQDLPGRDEARDAARQELERREYDEARPSLTYRAISWVIEKIQEALDHASSVPGGRLGVLLILLVAGLLVAVVVVRLRPSMRTPLSADLFEGAAVLTAAQHRQAADAAAARGDHAEAVRERLRAVVRSLEERGILDQRPGRTALEVSAEAAKTVPALAEPLRRGAVTFERIWYGGQPADASAYAVLVAVDNEVSGARLTRR